MRKHLRECVKLCESEGLTDVTILKGRKHLKIGSAQGMVVFPSTPSDRRWRHNATRYVRGLLYNC
jgi:hypothetical protein